MKTIWKFPIKVTDRQTVPMPVNAEILTAQVQGILPCLWAMVDKAETVDEDRVIEIFGTGNLIHVDMGVERKYIATFQQGPFVWHVFERVS